MNHLFSESTHRRWDPLKREWVLVSPHRTRRPWQGQTETSSADKPVQFDSQCYLCPGNLRAGGRRTPEYAGTYVFDNDYAALRSDEPHGEFDIKGAGLLRAATENGICRVLCFDPRHDLTLSTMGIDSVRRVVDEWANQESALSTLDSISHVQIFENRGAMMGASNPHPHGQIWATEHIPNEPLRELRSQRDYYLTNGSSLLLDYLRLEVEQSERIVAESEAWIALVPFWAVWPFELLLLPRQPVASLRDLGVSGRNGLASMLKRITAGYDCLFDTPFPYSMGFHSAPCDSKNHPEWQLHAHFYPPLLRSATVRKFMVGFELLGSPQRDITTESAALALRNVMAAEESEVLQ